MWKLEENVSSEGLAQGLHHTYQPRLAEAAEQLFNLLIDIKNIIRTIPVHFSVHEVKYFQHQEGRQCISETHGTSADPACPSLTDTAVRLASTGTQILERHFIPCIFPSSMFFTAPIISQAERLFSPI